MGKTESPYDEPFTQKKLHSLKGRKGRKKNISKYIKNNWNYSKSESKIFRYPAPRGGEVHLNLTA
jgi:hypothetical protein